MEAETTIAAAPSPQIEQAQVENIVAHIEADTAVTEAQATAAVAEAEAVTAIATAVVEQVENPSAAEPTAERDDVAWLTDRLDSQDNALLNLSQTLQQMEQSLTTLLQSLTNLLSTPRQTVVISSPPEPPSPPPTNLPETNPESVSADAPLEVKMEPQANAIPKTTRKRRRI